MKRSILLRDLKPFTCQKQIDKYLSGDRIACLLCGKNYINLSSHIIQSHDVCVFDYKEALGISKGVALVTSFSLEKRSKTSIEKDHYKTLRNIEPSVRKEYMIRGAKTKKKRTRIHQDKLNINFVYSSDNKGEKHGLSVLTDSDAKEIFLSTEKQKTLAKKYGTSQPNISLIWRRKAFIHVTKDLPDIVRPERRTGANRWQKGRRNDQKRKVHRTNT